MKPLTCGFIGLGLIGGSIAKALKEKKRDVFIYAYDINQDSLLLAQKEHIVDTALDAIDASFSECDFLFLCAPVSCNDQNLLLLKQYLPSDCILTDVGSVKTGIHQQISALDLDYLFIGAHPMTGSERCGYANSKARLLENAYYILTPSDAVSSDKVSLYQKLVAEIGAIPLILSYKQHDYVTAAVSHLPHVIASSLVNLVRTSDSPDGIMKLIAAGGFKDITRIASSSAPMWQQICLTNAQNISQLLDDYIHALSEIKASIDAKSETEIYDFFDSARIYRDSFLDVSSGPIKKVFSIQIDIADEPGVLATIAAMLAARSINVKNIGIVHNREAAEGALSIEFYSEEDKNSASCTLTAHGYSIRCKK